MIKAKGLPPSFWLEAIICANYVLNRCPTKALQTTTPYEAWTGRKPTVQHFKVFGCLAYALIPEHKRENSMIRLQNAFLWAIALREKATGCTTQVHGRLL